MLYKYEKYIIYYQSSFFEEFIESIDTFRHQKHKETSNIRSLESVTLSFHLNANLFWVRNHCDLESIQNMSE